MTATSNPHLPHGFALSPLDDVVAMLEPMLDHPRDRLLCLLPLGIERCSVPACRADPAPALHQGFLLPETPLPVEGVEAGTVVG